MNEQKLSYSVNLNLIKYSFEYVQNCKKKRKKECKMNENNLKGHSFNNQS